MELNDYQKRAMTTCTETSRNFSYMMLNLVGEVGEFASKIAKYIRKDYIQINQGKIAGFFSDDEEEELRKEAGDILWQLSGLCTVMEWSLEDVAQENLDKLEDRKNRNVIIGEGDNR